MQENYQPMILAKMRKCRVVPFSYGSPPFPNLTHSEVTWHLFVPLECVTGLKNGPAETEFDKNGRFTELGKSGDNQQRRVHEEKVPGAGQLVSIACGVFQRGKV